MIFLPGRACAESAAESAQGDSAPRAALLMEAETGQVLYSVNAAEKLPMASITKVMSLLVLADFIDDGTLKLEDRVAASSYASSAEGSVIWLEPGEEMTAAELLEAVIVSSANDACIALAEHTAGSEAQFVKLMNRRAKSMGLRGTKFTGCVGFDAEGHYSTAEDIAVMTAELVQKEYYRGWLLTWLDYLRGGGTQLLNTNKLVRTYDGILGGKTGTTDGAGCCLTVCAERGGMRLVAVVLGCKGNGATVESFSESAKLYNWAYNNFSMRQVAATDELYRQPVALSKQTDTVMLYPAQSVEAFLPKDAKDEDIRKSVTLKEDVVNAPVTAGQELGTLTITYNDQVCAEVPLLAQADVSASRFLVAKAAVEAFFAKTWVKLALVAVVVLVIVFILWLKLGRRSRQYGSRGGKRRQRRAYRGRRRW